MNKKDETSWWLKKLRNEKPPTPEPEVKIEIVPVEKDEYILLLEEQIDSLKKELKQKSTENSYGILMQDLGYSQGMWGYTSLQSGAAIQAQAQASAQSALNSQQTVQEYFTTANRFRF